MALLEPDVEACEFCVIGRGNDPEVDVVAEGPTWLAFFPHNPATPGHTLVIPRAHIVDLWHAEPPVDADLMAAVIGVGRAIHEALSPEGMNLISSAGATAEQTVFHLHLHLVPRWRRDGFKRIWPPETRYEDVGLEDVANRIREAYRRMGDDHLYKT